MIAIPLPNRLPYDPRLETILMVERFLAEHTGTFTRYQVWTRLPRKTMYQVFQVILAYLEESGKIAVDPKGKIFYIKPAERKPVKKLAYSPRLETVLMIGKFIEEHSSKFSRYQVWTRLPRKTMYQVFQVVLAYLTESNEIAAGRDGKIFYNPSRPKVEMIPR